MKDFKSILGKKDKDKKIVQLSNPKEEHENNTEHKKVDSSKGASQNKDVEPANLTIHSIFVKDISYEAPATPQAFSMPWEPQVKFDIQVMRRVIDQAAGLHEVVLHTTISTKLKNKNATDTASKGQQEQEIVAFLIDIKLAGMFTVKGLQDLQLDRVLSTTAPTILFPYAAESVASLVTRGGFPQFILPPIDFATLYQQRLDSQKAGTDTNKVN
jgi:preprotein translocase subunit SecB